MDGRDQSHPNGAYPDGESPDSIAFRAAMRDDPAAPGTTDEGGPVAHGRIELGYPFEDADVLADLFLNDGPTVAKIGPNGLVKPTATEPFLAEPKPQKQTIAMPVTPTPSRLLQQTEVELLLVGHLPVLGSAWVLQYAKHVAQHAGTPVGLIRLSGGEATVDLTLPPSEVPPQSGPMPSIAEAVRYVAQRTGRWIVRLDESADRASAADAASSIRIADRVTVLTGADEAAVVGCYRVIKTLEPGEATPRLHVAVMGSNPARADEAAGKLSRAAEKFLKSRVTSEACSAKITPGSSVNVYRGRPNAGHADLISLLRGGPAPTEEPKPIAVEPELEAEAFDQDFVDAHEPDSGIAEPNAVPPVTQPAFEATEFASAPILPPIQPRIEPRPTQAPAPTPSRAAVAKPPTESRGLARHLESLESLASKCPYAPEVELAVDPEGRLHLIARAASDPGMTLGALTTAKSWAEAHASLMAMAHPHLRTSAAVCHLMTDAPKSVRRLGDSDLRLHLLTAPPGTAEDEAGWVCVELN
ncbi:MAG: hypothetical protein JNM86_09580 [Phycisphaerae bacterium]|nr:hypothetical protein [Phycisphaerae bacterium]